MHIRHFLQQLFSILLIGVVGYVLSTPLAFAQFQIGGILGGGQTSVFNCSCTGGVLITVGPPTPGIFLFQPPGSVPYREYMQYSGGVWTLINASTGGTCLNPGAPAGCGTPISTPAEATVLIIGTSFPGAGVIGI